MKKNIRNYIIINLMILSMIYLPFCYYHLEWVNLFTENDLVDRGAIIFLFFASLCISYPISLSIELK